MRIVDDKLVADNEDYRLPPNELRVDHILGPTGGKLVVFRCLTENQHLFMAAVGTDEPQAVQMATGLSVLKAAQDAPTELPMQVPQILDARGQAL